MPSKCKKKTIFSCFNMYSNVEFLRAEAKRSDTLSNTHLSKWSELSSPTNDSNWLLYISVCICFRGTPEAKKVIFNKFEIRWLKLCGSRGWWSHNMHIICTVHEFERRKILFTLFLEFILIQSSQVLLPSLLNIISSSASFQSEDYGFWLIVGFIRIDRIVSKICGNI